MVARLNGVQEAAGSTPVARTKREVVVFDCFLLFFVDIIGFFWHAIVLSPIRTLTTYPLVIGYCSDTVAVNSLHSMGTEIVIVQRLVLKVVI